MYITKKIGTKVRERKSFLLDFHPDMHRALKLWCLNNNRTMRSMILDLIEEEIGYKGERD